MCWKDILSGENKQMLWIPPGFAHGFYALEDETHCLYKCTDYYAPAAEETLRWDDPTLAIHWPLLPDTDPILSAKDAAGKSFQEAKKYRAGIL